ncbi:MAG: SixA phosphatase family protein [Rhizomicrobium sp.]
MRRLLLLRHAKSVPAEPGIEDHERELMTRGRDDAPAVGKYLARKKYVPDLILSSTARRTVETTDLVTQRLNGSQHVDYVDALYLAGPREILAAIRAVPEAVKTLMVVGHNPGLEQVATSLSREPVKQKERDRFELIEEKFPTGALAVFDFDVPRWRDVAPGQGELIDFVRPRDL